MPTLLLLADGDDVFIATRAVVPGQQRTSRGDVVEVIEPIELGHKVAARAIASGQRIVRCGMPIGSAIVDIEAGEWVHTHNLASDYIVTFAHRGAVQ
ncbi:MAG: UxaA family hydrolase [Acidimicrobiales bacterium]